MRTLGQISAFLCTWSIATRALGVVFVVPTGTTETTTITLVNPGDAAIIEEGGLLAPAAGNGVDMTAINQTTLNKGTILTTNNGARGINNIADFNRMINAGLITTSGTGAEGIFNGGSNSQIFNQGSIVTLGDASDGIASPFGNNNLFIANLGSITAIGDGSDGIDVGGNNIEIISTGSILFHTHGIHSDGNGVQITNAGTITSPFDDAIGILNNGSNVQILNSGTISLSGPLSNGILSQNGTNVQITNSGLIEADLHGIFVQNSTNVSVVNSGTIRSTPGSSAILFLNVTNVFLDLLRGSNIQGDVFSSNPINLSVETGLNLFLSLEAGSAGFIIRDIEAPFVVIGDTIAVIDPTGLALQGDVLADLSDSYLNGVYRHRVAFPCCCGACDKGWWIEGLGSYRKRSHDHHIVGFHDWLGGFLVGYDLPSRRCGDLNLFGGASWGKAVVDENTQRNKFSSYVVGASFEQFNSCNFLGGALVTGYVRFHNDRFVMNNLAPGGVQKAHANAHAWLLSPEVTYARQFCTWWFKPIVSGTLRYAGLFLGKFNESGSAADLSVKHRRIHLLTARAEAGLPFASSNTIYCWSLEPYVGVAGRFELGDKHVDAELLGQALSFDPGLPHNLAILLLGFRSEQRLGFSDLFLNFEMSFDSERSARIVGELGIGFDF